ncbi:hypothetical protein FPRO06_02212 [Fusarium proliferatum]|nr:hypothetical protein FPRO06_02212 [Fusarium proliferatum]
MPGTCSPSTYSPIRRTLPTVRLSPDVRLPAAARRFYHSGVRGERLPPVAQVSDLASRLRVKKQREYAAIKDAGMPKPFKHAAIALNDGDDEASSEGVSLGPEIQMNPASLRARSWASSKRLGSVW